MGKYCIFASIPRYGSRDEIVGESHHKEVCTTQLRAAKKKLAAMRKADFENDEVRLTLCKGTHFCGQGWSRGKTKEIRRKRRKPKTTAKQRRAQRRDSIPF